MKRSKFNLSHYRLQSFHPGEFVPISLVEVLPGDSFNWDVSMLVRAAPLAAPLMHPVYVEYASWFVPNRLVWTGWEDFISDMGSGLTIPTRDVRADSAGSAELARMLGLGDARSTTGAMAVNALPLRGHNLIWNEFIRDQDLDTPLTVSTGNGPDSNVYSVQRVRKEKEYFSTARSAPQDASAAAMDMVVNVYETPSYATRTLERGGSGAGANVIINQAGGASGTDLAFGGQLTIEQWRVAMSQQKMREFQNRFGHRYHDRLRRLGVTPSDARLQRPELLGRGRATLQLSEVLTTGTEAETGEMSGHGIVGMRNRPWRRFFEEHGYVFCFMWVRPRQIYQDAADRTWFRSTWADYWQPETEILGEQSIPLKEIYTDTPAANLNDTFGYQQRHDEYRRHLSGVAGEFLTTLDNWQWATQFSSAPALNASFVADDPGHRVFKDTSGGTDDFRAMVYHRVAARRLVSKFARNA